MAAVALTLRSSMATPPYESLTRSDLDRVFEPFFSTRAGKGGTGLGLSITSGLVQELGGEIRVASEIGKGTIFTIVLPINNEKKGETVP